MRGNANIDNDHHDNDDDDDDDDNHKQVNQVDVMRLKSSTLSLASATEPRQ